MARALDSIGEIACQCCGERVPLKQQANGHAMYNCDWCGVKVQAWRSEASGKLKSRAKLNTPAPAPAPVASPAPEPKPAPVQEQQKKKAGAFSTLLGG